MPVLVHEQLAHHDLVAFADRARTPGQAAQSGHEAVRDASADLDRGEQRLVRREQLLERRDVGAPLQHAAVGEGDVLEREAEPAFVLAREQLAQHARAHVVADHARAVDVERAQQRLDAIGLLEQRVAVVVGLVREAEAQEVERDAAEARREPLHQAAIVVARGRKAVHQQEHRSLSALDHEQATHRAIGEPDLDLPASARPGQGRG
jgi:hypothetical protein